MLEEALVDMEEMRGHYRGQIDFMAAQLTAAQQQLEQQQQQAMAAAAGGQQQAGVA